MAVAKTIGKIVAITLLLAVVAILLFNLFLNIKLFEFYSSSKSIGDVPGLADGGVQQGLDYVVEEQALLVSCYMTNESASRIYVTKGGKTFYTELAYGDDKNYTGHVGGICHNGTYFYAGCSDGLKVYNLSDILAGGRAKMIGEISLINTASWCTVYNGHLYAGKYIDAATKEYAPKDEYIISNPKVENEVNCSIISVYKLSDAADATFGVDATSPVNVISAIGRMQGGAFTEGGNLILSTSYGIALSAFYFYDMAKASENTSTYTHSDGTKYPLTILGTDSLTYKLEGPPMSEEIVVIDGSLYIMNESACSKYIYGNLIGGREFYTLKLKDSYFGK